jgi:hypothetical protein
VFNIGSLHNIGNVTLVFENIKKCLKQGKIDKNIAKNDKKLAKSDSF